MITAEEFKALQKSKAKAHKYGAVRCRRGEIKFPSKLERAVYDELMSLKEQKRIKFFLRQVPFHLPGNTKHLVDYCIFSEEGVKFIEAKGRDYPLGKMKRHQTEEIYGITIYVVKKASEIHEVVSANE